METRAVISGVTLKTAFWCDSWSSHQDSEELEYQLLLMKISLWGRKVKIRYYSFGCDLWIFFLYWYTNQWTYFSKFTLCDPMWPLQTAIPVHFASCVCLLSNMCIRLSVAGSATVESLRAVILLTTLRTISFIGQTVTLGNSGGNSDPTIPLCHRSVLPQIGMCYLCKTDVLIAVNATSSRFWAPLTTVVSAQHRVTVVPANDDDDDDDEMSVCMEHRHCISNALNASYAQTMSHIIYSCP